MFVLSLCSESDFSAYGLSHRHQTILLVHCHVKYTCGRLGVISNSSMSSCWIAGRRHACLGGSIQSHKNKDFLYGRKSLESGKIEQIVYKYRASPTVRSIDFIIPMHHSKSSIPQVDRRIYGFVGSVSDP